MGSRGGTERDRWRSQNDPPPDAEEGVFTVCPQDGRIGQVKHARSRDAKITRIQKNKESDLDSQTFFIFVTQIFYSFLVEKDF